MCGTCQMSHKWKLIKSMHHLHIRVTQDRFQHKIQRLVHRRHTWTYQCLHHKARLLKCTRITDPMNNMGGGVSGEAQGDINDNVNIKLTWWNPDKIEHYSFCFLSRLSKSVFVSLLFDLKSLTVCYLFSYITFHLSLTVKIFEMTHLVTQCIVDHFHSSKLNGGFTKEDCSQ